MCQDCPGFGTQVSFRAGYLTEAFNHPGRMIRNARHILEEANDPEFDTMVGIGLSGALAVPILARAFNVNWAIVRKSNESAHSSNPWEGEIGRRWLFVDDLIDSGTTLRYTRNVVEQGVARWTRDWDDFSAVFVGAYLYDQLRFRDALELDTREADRRKSVEMTEALEW